MPVPRPRASSLRQLAGFSRDPYAYLDEMQRVHGDTFVLQLPRDPPRVVLAHPEDIARVFALSAEDYCAELQSIHLNIGESSVLFTDGERHAKQRRMMTPMLHGARLRSYAETMHGVIARRVSGWADGAELQLAAELREVTFDVILATVFGVDVDDPHGRELGARMHAWLDALLSPGVFLLSMLRTGLAMRRTLEQRTAQAYASARDPASAWLPSARLGALKAQLLHMLQADLDAARRDGVEGREDLLALLVEARYDDGAALDDEDILSQLVTMMIGGHETTSSTLAWALQHLCRRPDVVAKIRAELDETFGSSPAPLAPERCKELSYLDACIRESMRLSPIAPAVSRIMNRDLELRDGHVVHAGEIVWPSVYLAQRHPDVWDTPEQLRPERMLGKPARPTEFLPYGGGRRRCLGAAFAAFEMRILLAEILRRCKIELLAPDDDTPRFAGLTITLASGAPARIRHR